MNVELITRMRDHYASLPNGLSGWGLEVCAGSWLISQNVKLDYAPTLTDGMALALGISGEDAYRLYYSVNINETSFDSWHVKSDQPPKLNQQIVVDMLDRLLATGRVVWMKPEVANG